MTVSGNKFKIQSFKFMMTTLCFEKRSQVTSQKNGGAIDATLHARGEDEESNKIKKPVP